jgi:hypothetical protein
VTVRVTVAVAVLLSLACRPPRTPPADLSLDPSALRDQVLRARDRVRGVAGDARVAVDAPGGSGTVSQFIAAQRPDRLHLEVLDFFGNVAMVLSAGDGRFSLYDSREKVFYRGASTPENLARLLPLPMAAEDLVEILCGATPLLDGTAVAAAPGPGFVSLELARGPYTQSLRVGSEGIVERSSRRIAGEPGPGTYDLRFETFQQHGGVWFPRELALRASAPKVKLDVRWKRVQVNPELDDGMFRMEPPRGARIVELDDGSAPAQPPSPFQPSASPSGLDAPEPAGTRPPAGE